jgi:hypothetical protein
MKKIILMPLLIIALAIPSTRTYASTTTTTNTAKENTIKKCSKAEKKIRKKYRKVKIVSTGKKFDRLLTSRKNKKYYLVEKETGIVTNAKKGDGLTSHGYYISYKRVKGIKKGSRIVSYFVYQKGNNHIDDIIDRYDVVIKR